MARIPEPRLRRHRSSGLVPLVAHDDRLLWRSVRRYETSLDQPSVRPRLGHGFPQTLGSARTVLDRRLVEKRTYPAIDVAASGTRREELLMDPKELELTYKLRKVLADMNVVEAMELLKSRLKKVASNAEFLLTMSLD